MGFLSKLRGQEDPELDNYSAKVGKWLTPEWVQGQNALAAGLPRLQALVSGQRLPGGEQYLKGAERNYQTGRNRILARMASSGGAGFGGGNGVDQSYLGNEELARGEAMSRARLDYEGAETDKLRSLLLPLMNEQNQLYGQALGKTVIRRKGKRNLLKSLQGIGEGVAGYFSGNYGMMGQGLSDFAGGLQREDIVEGAGGGYDGGGGGGTDYSALASMIPAYKPKDSGYTKAQTKAYKKLPKTTQQYGVSW